MRILIDNLDGLGAREYSLLASGLELQRALNAPSRCTGSVVVDELPLPVRKARVVVMADDGTTLFTGYLATEPVREYAGEASEGAVYRARLTAVSDEWLLDRVGSGAGTTNGPVLALNGGALIARMAERAAGSLFSTDVASGVSGTGVFGVRETAAWSANAGAAAGAAYAGYRSLAGTLQVQPAGVTTHALSDADGTLSVSELALGNVRELANDVAVSGAEEPRAFVTECFIGDGTTAEFALSEAVFRDAERVMLRDSFALAGLDTTQWLASDPGGNISLTGAGLTLRGGTGADGVTTLAALDAIEMGGTVVADLGSVVLGSGSAGIVAGFYNGPVSAANCFAGFRVKQSGGNTVLVPLVNGVETGSAFTVVSGHAYRLRLRLHCAEVHRVMQRYYAMADGVVNGFGSLSGVDAAMHVVFELVDQGVSSSTPATVLYDSFAAGVPVTETPATCAFAVVDSLSLVGSVGSVEVSRPGSLWVMSVLSGGTQATRLEGVAGEGVDFEASYGSAAGTAGKITFFAGRVPAAGERVQVAYRTYGRAVARKANAASVAGDGVSRWLGAVVRPVARSSADCESACDALLSFATSRAAAVAGTYKTMNPAADVWPGDVLAITSAGTTTSVLVRAVTIVDGHTVPETLGYSIAFANDWATEWEDGLGMRLTETIAADAQLPATATEGAVSVLANLSQLAVASLSTTALALDAGVDPPSGGGFEVRRRDGAFGAGVDAVDVVLRSPVRSFSIPRAAQVERFYVRMYDASGNYSRWSSAVFVNAPVA